MELLRAELAKKQQQTARAGGRRWVKQSALIEERQREVERAAGAKRRRMARDPVASQEAEDSAPTPLEQPKKLLEARKKELATLERAEVFRRLRRLGEPVTLFGESDGDRCARLARGEEAQETGDDEFKLRGAYAIRNTFLQERQTGREEEEEEEEDDDQPSDDHGVIRRWVRFHLREWARELESRPEATKRAPHGRVETNTFKQCKDYVKPLVQLCERGELDPAMATSLAKIVKLSDEGEFVQAHDAYILIAIGNAAWPIGVTSVGIHTRTAREAVEQKNIAHVMNNEMQRKYLTSIKRLLRFAQDRRPDVPPSKKVQ